MKWIIGYGSETPIVNMYGWSCVPGRTIIMFYLLSFSLYLSTGTGVQNVFTGAAGVIGISGREWILGTAWRNQE